jgi:hypothetical protein
MSRADNWVALDKNLVQEFTFINRPYSRIEAMFSYTVDCDNGKCGTFRGYASLWQWSRNKTRKFIEEIRARYGHDGDQIRARYGHPIHFIDKGLQDDKGQIRTEQGPDKGQIEDTTSKTKTKTNNKKNNAGAFDPLSVRPDWFDAQSYDDLIEHRKKVKATNSRRAWTSLLKEIATAVQQGHSVDAIVDTICNRSWRGFQADWLHGKKRGEHDDTRARWARELLEDGNSGNEGMVGQIQGPQA